MSVGSHYQIVNAIKTSMNVHALHDWSIAHLFTCIPNINVKSYKQKNI